MNKFRTLYRKHCILNEWNIGIADMSSASLRSVVREGRLPPVRWCPRASPLSARADPFVWLIGDDHRVIFEEIDPLTHLGHIRSLPLGRFSRRQRARVEIAKPYHLSYPHIIECDNVWYCIPESARSSGVDLYAWNPVVCAWEFVRRLIDGVGILDATLYQHNGLWYLFGTTRGEGSYDTLRIWWSTSLQGEWRRHGRDPAKIDVGSARSAGPIFELDGQQYRPAQDCTNGYGSAVAINRIEVLTPFEFRETTVSRVRPDPNGRYPDGLHTFSVFGTRLLIDGRRQRFSAALLAMKAMRRIGVSLGRRHNTAFRRQGSTVNATQQYMHSGARQQVSGSKRSFRILFVPRESFPTDRVRINVLFGRELPSRGHQIDLVVQAADERAPPSLREWHGGSLWVGQTDSGDGITHRLRKHWRGFIHDIQCLRRARRSQYDAVLVSDKFLTASIGLLAARRRALKFIFWLTFPLPEADMASAHDGSARYRWVAWVRGRVGAWLLYKWILPRCDHVFVQSDRMKRNVCAHGLDPMRVSPILTGFGLTEIDAIRCGSQSRSGSAVTLAYLGTLDASRHLEILIDMVTLLQREGMTVKLLLVGDADRPRDRSLLEQRAIRQGVASCVEITGFLPQAEALRRVSDAQICLSPIHRSPILDVGSPTKLIEYLALGMPVVANDHPEQRLILRECRAGVCVPWAARHFARAVRWLMVQTAEERAAMGERGRKWVEEHRTYARIADEVERTLIDVVAPPGEGDTHRSPEQNAVV